jgi:hypothetical protein
VVDVAEGALVESRSGSGQRFGDHGVAEVGCGGGTRIPWRGEA